MEHALISRRVQWACSGSVEVAPDWPLGTPPLATKYFITQHHVRTYLRAITKTRIRPVPQVWTYLAIPHAHEDGTIEPYWFSWLELFCRTLVSWDNFRCHSLALLTWPHEYVMDYNTVKDILNTHCELAYVLCNEVWNSC